MQQVYLTTPEAAKYLKVGVSMLERGRVSGKGPKFRQLGLKRIVYAVSDLDEWAAQRVLTSTSERAAA